MSFAPQFGYFFVDNLVADFLLNYERLSSDDWSSSTFSIGVGGRYFYNQLYGGLGFMMQFYSEEDDWYGDFKYSANYLDFKAGYLLPVVQNVFVDFGLGYALGLGKYGGDYDIYDNEESIFGIYVGLQIFFPAR
ncbi:MAG: hypothetical protein K0B81_01735 [Candidatus Cloacimonetes bacterium]|nr:hypothetical protein [Candidatus Cloacimonadota bacterium]